MPIDYENLAIDGGALAALPDSSVDLVTLMMGLHHFEQARQLGAFLAAVKVGHCVASNRSVAVHAMNERPQQRTSSRTT